jgi:hypothetical protein
MPILDLRLSKPRLILSGITPQEPTGGIADLAEALRVVGGDGRKLLFDCHVGYRHMLEVKGGEEVPDGVLRIVAVPERKAGSGLGWMQYVSAWEDREAQKKHDHCFEAQIHVDPDTFALFTEQATRSDSLSLSVDTPSDGAIQYGWAPDGSVQVWDTAVDNGIVRLVGYQLIQPVRDSSKDSQADPFDSIIAEIGKQSDRLVAEVAATRTLAEVRLGKLLRGLPLLLAAVIAWVLLLRSC